MSWLHKLKPASFLTALWPPIVVLTTLAILWSYIGIEAAYTFIGVIFVFFSVSSLINLALTKNTAYIVVALFQISAAFAFAGRYSSLFYISDQFTRLMTSLLLFFLIATIYLWYTKRLKWRVREILELAAAPVKETTNGFTSRPRPSGKVDCSRFELKEFAAFALKHHIAVPYYESDRVVLVAADWTQAFLRLYNLRRDYDHATWVAFDYDGNVTVNIARHDYLKYKDSFSFDQLCGSLGEVFIEFLELFKRGEAVRIIDKLNAVREHPAS